MKALFFHQEVLEVIHNFFSLVNAPHRYGISIEKNACEDIGHKLQVKMRSNLTVSDIEYNTPFPFHSPLWPVLGTALIL
jgi:hypothetical protein